MEGTSVSPEQQLLTKPIPIKKTQSRPEINPFIAEYSLKQNFFDPTKSSPPDDFMEKLELRMQHYYNNVLPRNIDPIIKTA